MEDLSKLTKDDLIWTCEKLRKKLKKYESRLSALVEAYKNLIGEKKILEETISSMSSPGSITNTSKETTASKDDSPKTEALEDPLGALSPTSIYNSFDNSDVESSKSKSSVDVKTLEEKIVALSNALQAMNDSKTKNEAIYQNDKKALLVAHKQEVCDLTEERDAAQKSEKWLKQKLRQEQKEREEEQKIHSSMLKELQSLVESERIEKEELRLQLNERIPKESLFEHEQKISLLEKEISSLKDNIEKTKLQEEEPEQQIRYLTGQLENLKQKHTKDLVTEQRKAFQAEQLLKTRQMQEERRVADLESRLTELSLSVGDYDRHRNDDQKLIRELQEKLQEINNEDAHLERSKSFESAIELQKVSDLQDQVVKLKNLLKMTWRKTDRNLQRMSSSEIDELLLNDPAHHACQEEYKQLKNEFELYKKKYSLQKNTEKDTFSDDIINYKKKIELLEESLVQHQREYELSEKEHLNTITRLQVELTQANDKMDLKIENIKEKYKKHLEQADEELKKQRNRLVELINEKDLEIEQLKEKIFKSEDDAILLKSANKQKSDQNLFFGENFGNSPAEALLLASPTGSVSGHGLFHFNQQVSHLEQELSTARAQINDLQGAVVDSERREDKVLEQMEVLKEEIRSLERSRSRESANLEYLKNLSLQFILSDTSSKKTQMLNAISTILKFSPHEIQMIEKRKKGWWG